MTRTVNIAIVAALILGVATIAAAVAGTTRSPRASDIPVMVTSRNATATPAPAAPSRTMTSAVSPGRIAPSKKPTGGQSDSKPPASSGSGGGGSQGSGTSSGSGANGAGDGDGHDDEVEVVKPPVHEENEPSDGYNPGESEPDSD